jgi:predicted lipoprotein with Yx(FWY)xxD motif
MPQSRTSYPLRLQSNAILTLIAILVSAGLLTSTASAAATKSVAKQANSPSLGHKVLTANNGLTLYTLSAETHGNFICKGACLRTWFPLIVAKGVKPTGPVPLGTVKRPDGRRQVTFKGRPLYTFDGDSRKGDASGEGFKDVGTWHAATP